MTVPVQIVTVLGLASTASVDDAVAAIQQIKTSEAVALNRAQNPDLTKFIPVETYQLSLNRAEAAENRLKELDVQTAESLVNAAVDAGKVAPANRDMYLALCRSEEGRKQFTEFVKTAPALVNTDPSKGKENKDNTKLSDDELAMCRAMGITEAEFLAAKPAQE